MCFAIFTGYDRIIRFEIILTLNISSLYSHDSEVAKNNKNNAKEYNPLS
jgi:hypothetical protein